MSRRIPWPRPLFLALWAVPLLAIIPLRAIASWRPTVIAESGEVQHLAFAPDGGTLAVDTYGDNGQGLHLRDMPGAKLKWSSQQGAFNYSGVEDLVWAPHSRLLVAANHHIIDWSEQGGKSLFDLSYPSELAISPENKWIVATGQKSQGSEVVLWNLAQNRPQWRQVVKLNFVQTAFSARYLCLGGEHLEGQGDRQHVQLQVFDPISLKPVRFFPAPLFHINDMEFCPLNPAWLALTDNSGLSVLDVQSGRRLFFFPFMQGHGALATLAFSPDGSLLAIAESTSSSGPSSDVLLFEVKISNSKTPLLRRIRTLVGHTAWVTALSFSPDGNTLATGGYDRKLRLWRVR